LPSCDLCILFHGDFVTAYNLKYNARGHKLRSPVSEKAKFVTALGISSLFQCTLAIRENVKTARLITDEIGHDVARGEGGLEDLA
jgi:hypothetical protein